MLNDDCKTARAMKNLTEPLPAALYLRSAGHFLSEMPNLSAAELQNALIDEDDKNRIKITLWDAIERHADREGDDPYLYTEELISTLFDDFVNLLSGI